jgi:hypothetical protein
MLVAFLGLLRALMHLRVAFPGLCHAVEFPKKVQVFVFSRLIFVVATICCYCYNLQPTCHVYHGHNMKVVAIVLLQF